MLSLPKTNFYELYSGIRFVDYLSGDEAKRQQFIQGFGKAYSEIGFAAINNHGIPQELINKYYGLVEQFYDYR